MNLSMSRDGVDDATLEEVAAVCHVSVEDIQDLYACTPLQMSTMAESSIRAGANVFQFVLSLASSVDLDRFCNALTRVFKQNSVLRTRLVNCRLGLQQVVTAEEHVTRRCLGDVWQYLRDIEARPMGLGSHLFRSAIINGSKLVLTMHHAIMDHTSLTPLFRDVLCVYHGGEPEKRAPFKDFVAKCTGIDETEARSFWASRFKGAPTIFPRVRPGHVPHATNREARKIALNQIGSGVPLAHVPSFIEVAWALTAGVYTDSESVAFGVVLSGRTRTLGGAETTLGPTMTIVPVHVNLKRSMTVEEALKERTTARRQLQAHPALQYGLPGIRSVSDAAQAASGFQTLLNIRPVLADPGEAAELSYEYMDEPQGAFGICLSCNLLDDGVMVEARSDPEIVCERQLHRTLNQFEHMLQSLMKVPLETKLDRLPKLNAHDRSEILQWNNRVPAKVENCLHNLFTAQAEERPTAMAVEAWDGSASYRDLNNMTDRLAQELRRRGVSTGDPVAFIFEKSLWTVVAVLAILKAGGVCVPIAASDPRARKEALVSGANAKMVLTSAAEHASSADIALDVFPVSAESMSKLPDVSGRVENGTSSPSDLAYIIFTSGSTGTPKGVMLEHHCLASSLTSLSRRFGWEPGFRMLQFAAHVWDISMGEMFGALLFGGCLCIPSEEARQSHLANFITSARVGWAWLTPTVMRTLSPGDVPGLQSLLSIGEPIDAGAARTWGEALRLINGWGPCEASILSAVAELAPGSRHPESIGTPVGCALWIVNKGNPNELAPVGSVGELLVEGPGVARGYLNDAAKTTASFIPPPPWAPSARDGERRFYRTGDLARYNPDGSICFVGRQDNQVKIRGQRFELGELEAVLSSCSEAQDLLASTKISGGRTELVAVVCLADMQLPSAVVLREVSEAYAETTTQRLRAIRDYANSRLPSFMVPTIWLAIEKMPRTESTKLDRAAVREWLRTRNLSAARAALDARMATALTPPATKNERLLQSIWSSVLAVPEEKVGRESTFVQLGGDSILAMQAACRCLKGGLCITTAAMLRNESLAAIAESSRATESNGDDVVPSTSKTASRHDGSGSVSEPGAVEILSTLNIRYPQCSQSNARFRRESLDGIVPATDAQAFMLATGETGGRGCYVDFTCEFKPALDTHRLRKACEQVILHHSILRTVFVQHGPVLFQAVFNDSPTGSVKEVTAEPERTLQFGRDAILARFHLVSDGQVCRRLCLEIHHALYDALSIALLFRDLDAAYSGRPLSDGPHYHSWVSHVADLDESAPRGFWRDMLQGSVMPHLVPRPAGTVPAGHPLDQRTQMRVPLRNMRTPCGTPSSVFKAAWSVLLSLALGMEDVVFGQVSANRYLTTLPGIEQVRGPCINYLPARARLGMSMTLASVIEQMQHQTTASMPYHHYPFRSIIRDCTDWPSCTRFSSAVTYQNHGALRPSLEIGDATGSFSGHGTLGDSADIWVIATPGAEDLEVEFLYSSRVLPAEQIHWISQAFLTILEAIPTAEGQSLSHIHESVRSAMGSYVVPLGPADSLSNPLNGHPQTPPLQAREAVLRAWEELELVPGDQGEDCSMFSCGADVVAALLLSEQYRQRGYDISIRDVVQHPTRLMQACLVAMKR
ncbi:Nonribosomal peptide synthetase-like protein [Tolypocladium capitatum]|uniref:Nonribosomal peptide synthetase-like protein n=1 Tax=Tolypocladium capitatum TaxID=45235 RepID=A0A2K3QJW4_9HYPO|nr:Nonribosomal peptide synthetase-like protein [Tolypocladium capitatum]